MKVELKEHTGRNMATGKEESCNQYRVFADGRAVGYMGWRADSKLMLVVRLGPIEKKEVERQVAELLEKPIETREAPDVPPELLTGDTEEGISIDDFN